MKPLIKGPKIGPAKAPRPYKAIGLPTGWRQRVEENKCDATDPGMLAFANKSLIVPPATLRKAEAQKPVRNRNTRYTAVGCSGLQRVER